MASDTKYTVITEKKSNLELLINPDNEFAKNIINNGISDYPLIDWCIQFVWNKDKPSIKDKCFIDVGAHIGTHSLILAPYCQRVYSFEPHRSSYHALAGGIVLNGLVDKVYSYNLALGGPEQHNTRSELYIPTEDGVGATMIKDTKNMGKTDVVERPTIYALDEMKLRNIGLIKINTNGSELNVLKGAAKTIALCRPRILLYCQKEQYDELVKFMETIDYKLGPVAGCPNYYLCGYDKSS